ANGAEDLRGHVPSSVAAPHGLPLYARVADRDQAIGFSAEHVLTEVVRALADGADDAPCAVSLVRPVRELDAVLRAIERRAHEVVHARVEHHPASIRRDLLLDDAADEHAVRADERASWLHVERERVQS